MIINFDQLFERMCSFSADDKVQKLENKGRADKELFDRIMKAVSSKELSDVPTEQLVEQLQLADQHIYGVSEWTKHMGKICGAAEKVNVLKRSRIL